MESGLISKIREIYDGYIADTLRLEAERKPGDGLLGFGRSPAHDPCHDLFSDRLQMALKSAEDGVLPAEAAELLRLIYNAPVENENNKLAYWMLIAVQAHTKDSIRFLTKEDAAALLVQYNEMYPKRTRLPVQKEIAALLNVQAGGKTGRFGIINLFLGGIGFPLDTRHKPRYPRSRTICAGCGIFSRSEFPKKIDLNSPAREFFDSMYYGRTVDTTVLP